MNRYLNHRAEAEFSQLASMSLIPLEYCTTTEQLKDSMEQIHHLINTLKAKYGLVPEKASLMFARYISKHDRLVFEKFQQEYSC